jgi:hypothetical protein
MAHASFHHRQLAGRRLDERWARVSRRVTRRTLPFDRERETRAMRGAMFGVMLSVPLWAIVLTAIYWLTR